MKKMRILVLVLACILAVGVLASCSSDKVTANVTISVVADDDAILTNYEIAVVGTADAPPTVLQAMREAMLMHDAISFSDNGASVIGIAGYEEAEDEDFTYFWEYTINGVAATSGKAIDNTIKEGDAIRFTYATVDKSKL